MTFNAYWLDGEGRIVNCYGERVLSTRVWESEIDADYWLTFVSPDGRFGTAYIAGKTDYVRTVAAPHKDGEVETASKTLDRWLMRNGLLGSVLDAELLDAVPVGLRGVYEKRLGLETPSEADSNDYVGD